MRNISFALTTDQVRGQTKTVTRRLRWLKLKAGERLQAVVKGMGLKPGEKIKRICVIEVVSVRREPLNAIDADDVRREGFPELSRRQFITMFCKSMKCKPTTIVTRIEFKYVD